MSPDAIALPVPPAAARRTAVPVLAALVPIVGGIAMWLLTQSVFALCFAALGPLMMIASALDARRHRRRDRRRMLAEEDEGWARAERRLRDWHEDERAVLWQRHPDLARCVREIPLRDGSPATGQTLVVLGAGTRASNARVSGRPEGTPSEREKDFRTRATLLRDAPIVVPLGGGICLQGSTVVTSAVARAVVTQLCLRFAPEQLCLSGAVAEIGVDGFPHVGSAIPGAFRVVVAAGTAGAEADCVIHLAQRESAVPSGITTVVDCTSPRRARLRTAEGSTEFRVECFSHAQTGAIAAEREELDAPRDELADHVDFSELRAVSQGVLAAPLGRGRSEECVLDLVEDGPHAIVTGITGSGKSELLVTWITAIAAQHPPEEVTFVLADFKGGSAFDPLRVLPHVVAVVTDLDDVEARRGVQSLTAELRRREQVLAAAAVRSIDDDGVRLTRLVIVVDEFAALLQEHPDLAAVFTDLAARGRALGMHLILGTQRADGVIRDALAANCPLRVSLRVSNPADSRLVLGVEDAATIPGGPGSRGRALVRTPQAERPESVRVALTSRADIARVCAIWKGSARPESPWLPALPEKAPFTEIRVRAREEGIVDGALILGIADEPDRQRQPVVAVDARRDRGLAIIGAPGSGRSNGLRMIAAQAAEPLVIPADLERAWDLLEEWGSPTAPVADVVIVDDIDQLCASFPPDYAKAFVDRLERIVRAADGTRCFVAIGLSRPAGTIARIIDALPLRMMLRMGSKLEHLAAGGETDAFLRERPAGRGRLGGREVQLCEAAGEDAPQELRRRRRSGLWSPGSWPTGLVAPHAGSAATMLREAGIDCRVDELAVRVSEATDGPAQAHVIVGDAASWQREWALLQRLRAEGEILVAAECGPELRSLLTVRELPPYAHPHRGRAWSLREGRALRRVILPGHLRI